MNFIHHDYTALETLTERYRTTILSDQFRLRIRERELRRLFPFSIHNIYRMLLSISDIFYDGFEIVLRDLDNEVITTNLGLPNRVFRYGHTVILGACDRLTPERLATLAKFGTLALNKIESNLSLYRPSLPTFDEQSQEERRAVITLAVYLREFVDLLYMGQHDQGFISYPPFITPNGVVVLRQFFNLPLAIVSEGAIDIYTLYSLEAKEQLYYDPFRGDIERLPSPDQLRGAVAILKKSQRTLTTSEASSMIAAISRSLIVEKDRLMRIPAIDAEKDLAHMFCLELSTLLRLSGSNVQLWHTKIDSAVESMHSLDPTSLLQKDPSYTDKYITTLKSSFDMLRKTIRHDATI